MKKFGKLIEYDNYCGIIIDDNGIKYRVLSKDILYNNAVINDFVQFDSETFKKMDGYVLVARFVKKYIKK